MFKEWEVEAQRAGRRRLMDNEISIASQDNKNSHHYIMFSQSVSQLIKDRGYYWASIAQDDITSEIAIIIKNEGRIPLMNLNAKNIRILNKSVIDRLCMELKINLNDKSARLRISGNISKRSDTLCYKILEVI